MHAYRALQQQSEICCFCCFRRINFQRLALKAPEYFSNFIQLAILMSLCSYVQKSAYSSLSRVSHCPGCFQLHASLTRKRWQQLCTLHFTLSFHLLRMLGGIHQCEHPENAPWIKKKKHYNKRKQKKILRSTADAIDQLWKGLKTKTERKAVVDLINRLPTKTAIADENLDTVVSGISVSIENAEASQSAQRRLWKHHQGDSCKNK